MLRVNLGADIAGGLAALREALGRLSPSRQGAVVLAGDVGGTKSNLGLFEVAEGVPHALRSRRFASPDYPSLTPLLREFLLEEGARMASGSAPPASASPAR